MMSVFGYQSIQPDHVPVGHDFRRQLPGRNQRACQEMDNQIRWFPCFIALNGAATATCFGSGNALDNATELKDNSVNISVILVLLS